MDELLNDDIELTPEELAKLMLPSTTLILPWKTVQKKIETIVANNNYYQKRPATGEDDDQHHDDNSALNVSIPTGFQILRMIGPSKLPIKSVIALSQGESTKLGCIDSQFAHIWQGNSHLTKIAIGQTRGNNMDNASPLSGLDLWIYVPSWKMIVLSTTALEIKVKQPNRSIGHITFYNFKNVSKHTRNSGMVELDSPFLTINDLEIDDWISKLAVDQKRELLFAVYENHVNIYNLKTGVLIEKLLDIHSAPITQILLWLPFGYWITSSKDATIKVWNSQNCLLFQFKEHYQPVTGMCLATVGNETKSTYLLSCSMDCTIRMWNLEDGFCINKYSSLTKWLKDSTFQTFSEFNVTVWSLNRFFSVYCTLGTPLTNLQRVTAKSIPSRIFAYGSDGSILIVSPRTGQKLLISFPFVRNTIIVEDRIYLLADTGSVLVYTAFFSPCLMAEEWEYTVFQEKVSCMTGLPPQESFETVIYNNVPMQYFLLICGTDSGQIVTRDIRDQGFQSFVIQAHGAPCIQVLADDKGEKLTSCSLGRNIYMELILLSTLQTVNTVPDGIAFDYKQKAIGVATKNKETLVFQEKQETPNSFCKYQFNAVRLKPHPPEDDHVHTITKLDVLETLPLLVNASIDGVVKIWDLQTNTLIRGDLLVALPIEIVLVQVQDYLPPEYLEKLLQFNFEDDELEAPEKFDISSKHWKRNKRRNMFGIDFDKKPVDIVEQLLPLKKPRETVLKYPDAFEVQGTVDQGSKSRRMTMIKRDYEEEIVEPVYKKRFFDVDENENVVYNVPELSLEKMLQSSRPKTYEYDAASQLKIINPLVSEPEVTSIKAPVIPPIASTETTAKTKEAKQKKRKVDRLEAMELVQRNRLKKLIEEKETKKKQEQEALKLQKNAALDIPRPNAQGLQGPNINLVAKNKEGEEMPELPKKHGRSQSIDMLLQSTESLPPLDDVTINYAEMFDDYDEFETIPPTSADEGKNGKRKKKKAKGGKGDKTPAEEVVPLPRKMSKQVIKSQSLASVTTPLSKKEDTIIDLPTIPKVVEDEKEENRYRDGEDIEGVKFSTEYQNAELHRKKMADMILIDDYKDENFRDVIHDKKSGLFKGQRSKLTGNYRSYYPKEGLYNYRINLQSRNREAGGSQDYNVVEEQDSLQTAWKLDNPEPKGPPKLSEQSAASVAWGLFKIALKQAQMKKEGLLSENVVKDLKSIYSDKFSFQNRSAKFKGTSKKEIQEEKKKPITKRPGQIYVGIIDGEKESQRLNGAIPESQKKGEIQYMQSMFQSEKPQVELEAESHIPEIDQLPKVQEEKPRSPPKDKRLLFMPQKNRYNDGKTKVTSLDDDFVEEEDSLPQRPVKEESKSNLFTKPGLKKLGPLSKISTKVPQIKVAKESLHKQDAITGWNEFNTDLQLQPDVIPTKTKKGVTEQAQTVTLAPKVAADGDLDMVGILASAPWFPDFSDKSNITVETLVKGLMQVLQNETMDEESKVEAALCMRFIEETFETDFQQLKEFVLNAELDLLEVAPAKLQVQIIENLGASKQTDESIMLSLITSLNSKDQSVVNAAIAALGNFGISTKEALSEAMKKYHMFYEYRIYTPKEKFVHPLDILLEKINNENEANYRLSLNKVEIWRRKVDPRIQGIVVLRPDSSLVTLVPKERHRRQALHDTKLSTNISTHTVGEKKKKVPFYQRKGYVI
ncbi:hypothetical protein HDV04_003103 [Boothiomyces sp. JEL0838]|nr:hypothetical protein HDV04_004352 [Boothiomyces sp. JEL0838]KAJ3312503.1 hypothetical protein HDV04_003103 [Boothiomyces sp. JEL0838]